MTQDIEKVDPFDVVGLEAVMATLAMDYIKSHCVLKDGRKFYQGDAHVMRWYTEYDHKRKEAYASKQTQITKGV